VTSALLDWRRRIAEIYAAVRREPKPLRAHDIWRAGREALLTGHDQSPLPPELRGRPGVLRHAAYDAALRFDVELEPAPEQRIDVPTGTDGIVSFDRVGRVELPGLGDLDVWWLRGYGGGLFLPMADTSAASYPGGRYVLDTVKGADLGGTYDAASGRGTLVVDLNFAYNPSCAYDPAWACPLAPPGNRLDVPVDAGELLPDLMGSHPSP
jgi:uncharacterized protein (DUF1684 family)